MTQSGPLQFDVGLGVHCPGCDLTQICEASRTEFACHPDPLREGAGGLNAPHPTWPDLDLYFAEIDGPTFETVVATPIRLPAIPAMTPRMRACRSLAGELYEARGWAIGPEEVVTNRRSVLEADELRQMTDLWGNQQLLLVLFGSDRGQEYMWTHRDRVVAQIAQAGYDLVTPPSFSVREGRPASASIYNLKRSLFFYGLLLAAGAPAVPRLAWLFEHDVRRAARWIQANPPVEMVALDMAIKVEQVWRHDLRLLALFDALTDQRLRYLIHGPAVESRVSSLFNLLGERLRLTGGRAAARKPDDGESFRDLAANEIALVERLAKNQAASSPLLNPSSSAQSPVPLGLADHGRRTLSAREMSVTRT